MLAPQTTTLSRRLVCDQPKIAPPKVTALRQNAHAIAPKPRRENARFCAAPRRAVAPAHPSRERARARAHVRAHAGARARARWRGSGVWELSGRGLELRNGPFWPKKRCCRPPACPGPTLAQNGPFWTPKMSQKALLRREAASGTKCQLCTCTL